ncbi:oligodendrocyte-myelin glycoprotein [Bradysia coprophila]|uniref:oligodendrocyte-myelin glycoprotein n=1 Tax=Bradysia coprophila TaxID=38358 RepID=UPI00187DAA56|nr:oligodendrocyte-myelin glycoprotein [Bradysia coprophila]
MNRTLKRHQIQNFFKMKNLIVNGLFIVLICSLSTRLSQASPSDDDYDDYTVDEDYYVYDDDPPTEKSQEDEMATENSYVEATVATQINAGGHNVTDVKISSIAAVHEDEKTESVLGVFIADTDVPEDSNCPRFCSCDEQYQFIDCSNRSLSEIPKNLPNTTLHINLAHNSIKEIQENDLSNLTVVRQIILKNNSIQNVNQNMFQSLHRLDDLDLSSNNISEIDPDLFLHAQSLSSLTLDSNPVSFKANHSFLNLPGLEVLNLVDCNITEFYDQTFTNLSGLTGLNLANNSFATDMNVVAFYPLVSLLKLKLPHVSRNETYELCEKIQAIDVISFDMYNISCYELVSGSTYDESTITHAPPTVHVEITTTPMPTTSTMQISVQEVTEATTKATKQNVTEKSPRVNTHETITNTEARNTTNGDDVKSQELEKSTQSMKTILIASIVIAVIGLAIGLVCRKDVFGVKTKLCRTQRPEPPTIPEQVPLNKV